MEKIIMLGTGHGFVKVNIKLIKKLNIKLIEKFNIDFLITGNYLTSY